MRADETRTDVGPNGAGDGPTSGAAESLAVTLGQRHYIDYAFESEAMPAVQWQVQTVAFDEEVCRPYVLQLELIGRPGDDPAVLLGSSGVFRMMRVDYERVVHGIVSAVSARQVTPSRRVVDVTVVPALAALAQRRGSRIFTGMTVPQVVEQVLSESLRDYGRRHEPLSPQREYPVREYIVQYQETDLEFIQRVTAEEGVWFFFRQPERNEKGAHEVVVLVDYNDQVPAAALGRAQSTPRLGVDGVSAPSEEAVVSFSLNDVLTPAGIQVIGEDWTRAAREQRSHPSDVQAGRAMCEHRGVTYWNYKDPQYRKSDAADQARLHWEQVRSKSGLAFGRSNIVGLAPGHKLTISGHADGLDGEWVVLAVTGDSAIARDGAGDARPADYQNKFSCIRAGTPYRPERVAKPTVNGVQTALVVGNDGKPNVREGADNVCVDEHGRVRVKFGWDRTEAGKDGTKTCWLRVSQPWAGPGFGAMFLPRVGTEVVVSFLDGDPDRPLVTGCLYNGHAQPFYKPFEHRTKSYIKTCSSPTGKGGNELCFEDKDDHQLLFVRAQKDYKEEVGNDQTKTITGTQIVEVGGAQFLTVAGKRAKDVGGEQGRGEVSTIRGSRELKVTKNNIERIEGAFERKVGETYQLNVAGSAGEEVEGDKLMHVKGTLGERVDAARTCEVAEAWSVRAKSAIVAAKMQAQLRGGTSVTIDAGELLKLIAGKNAVIEAAEGFELKCGKARLVLKSDGNIELRGKSIRLQGSSDVTIKGSKVAGN